MKKSELIRAHISCTCDPAYKLRGLVDPDCALCKNEEEISDIMIIYANSQLVEFVNWSNSTSWGQIPNSYIRKFNLQQNETPKS